jgi:hypothetical protein
MDVLNIGRMIQKFLSKKPSVGYSHPPILEQDKTWFKVFVGKDSRCYKVTVEPWELKDELRDLSGVASQGLQPVAGNT